MLDTAKKTRYFSDESTKSELFVTEYDKIYSVPVAKVEVNPCALCED